MNSSSRLIVAILVVAALAIGFWVLLLGPKREEADKLRSELETQEVALAQANSNVQVAELARQEFPDNYRQLVVLGEAVPEGDETSSLLVEINRIAANAKVSFKRMELTSGSTSEAPSVEAHTPPPTVPSEGSNSVPASEAVAPTEAAAALMPLGATIGPAGLGVMPYTFNFSGTFFEIADFLNGVDRLVETRNAKVGVEGRLVTVDGFSLVPSGEEGDGESLEASFIVTTFVTPPGQGVTAGATSSEPAPVSSATAPTEESAETTEVGAAQ